MNKAGKIALSAITVFMAFGSINTGEAGGDQGGKNLLSTKGLATAEALKLAREDVAEIKRQVKRYYGDNIDREQNEEDEDTLRYDVKQIEDKMGEKSEVWTRGPSTSLPDQPTKYTTKWSASSMEVSIAESITKSVYRRDPVNTGKAWAEVSGTPGPHLITVSEAVTTHVKYDNTYTERPIPIGDAIITPLFANYTTSTIFKSPNSTPHQVTTLDQRFFHVGRPFAGRKAIGDAVGEIHAAVIRRDCVGGLRSDMIVPATAPNLLVTAGEYISAINKNLTVPDTPPTSIVTAGDYIYTINENLTVPDTPPGFLVTAGDYISAINKNVSSLYVGLGNLDFNVYQDYTDGFNPNEKPGFDPLVYDRLEEALAQFDMRFDAITKRPTARTNVYGTTNGGGAITQLVMHKQWDTESSKWSRILSFGHFFSPIGIEHPESDLDTSIDQKDDGAILKYTNALNTVNDVPGCLLNTFPTALPDADLTLSQLLEHVVYNYGSLLWFTDTLFPYRAISEYNAVGGVRLKGLTPTNIKNIVDLVPGWSQVAIGTYNKSSKVKDAYDDIMGKIKDLSFARSEVFNTMRLGAKGQAQLLTVLSTYENAKRTHYPFAKHWFVKFLSWMPTDETTGSCQGLGSSSTISSTEGFDHNGDWQL
jgi:hypothetical protein